MLTSTTPQKKTNVHFSHPVAISSLNVKTKLYLFSYAFIKNGNFHTDSKFPYRFLNFQFPYLSLYPSIYLSTYLSIHLFIYLHYLYTLYTYIYIYIYMYIYIYIYIKYNAEKIVNENNGNTWIQLNRASYLSSTDPKGA